MPSITLSWKDTEARRLLSAIEGHCMNMAPVWNSFGAHMVDSVRQNFLTGGRPTPWKPISAQSWIRSFGGKTYHKGWESNGWGLTAKGEAALKGRKPLIATGRLMNSIHAKLIPGGVGIGTNVLYAAIHQFGGKTPPRIIRPRVKKALFWYGAAHPVKAVHHPGAVIPARPFLLVQEADWKYLTRLADKYLLTGRAR